MQMKMEMILSDLDLVLFNQAGQPVALRQAAGTAGAVVVFYRGHWCPYCRRYLSKLQQRLDEIKQRGLSLLAISPEPPATANALAGELGLAFPLLSDRSGAAIDRFGVRHPMLRPGHLLPHPAVFVFDAAGRLRFSQVDENFKQRTTVSRILREIDRFGENK